MFNQRDGFWQGILHPFSQFVSYGAKVAIPYLLALSGYPCGDAEALRPMKKLAEVRHDHNRGICNILAKFPALHIFMFHAGISRAHQGRGCYWLGCFFSSQTKREKL